MNNNTLSGPLSPKIGNLVKLEFLQLQGNQFTSTIPSELGLLEKLRKFLFCIVNVK